MHRPHRPHRPLALARPSSIAAISVAIALLAAGPIRAQSADAGALFDRAEQLMSQGKIAEACEAFAASNRSEARAGTLIRLGQCREANHQLASAWVAYKDALGRVKDPRKREVAIARIAALEPRLSYLTVAVPDASRIAGLAITRNGVPLDPASWNHAVPVDSGKLVVLALASGHRGWLTRLVVTEGGTTTVDVPRLAAVVVSRPPARVTSRASVPSARRWTAGRKAAIAIAGGGVAAFVASGVLGWQARAWEHEAYRLCPDPLTPCDSAPAAQSALDRARRRGLYANVGLGLGAGAVIGAFVLWYVAAPNLERRISFAPSVSPAGAEVSVRVTF